LRVIAAVIFGSLLLAAIILRTVTGVIANRLGRQGQHAVAPQVLRTVRNTGALFLVALGVSLSLATLPEATDWREEIAVGWKIIATILIAQTTVNAIRVVLNWYLNFVAPRTDTKLDDSLLPLVRRVAIFAAYGIALMVILDTLGISISPFLGGLGITGLAVALALQPTLGNFFAGTYVMSDGAIGVGDYIELQSGPAGYVVDVGWRSTKIRTWLNNLVIIPNAVMADTIVTNYNRPQAALSVLVTSGVSYESDLVQVERVSLEVARSVIAETPQADETEDAFFGFDSFGESNITFWIYLRAMDRFGSFIVTNKLIKELHARYAIEGIQINYPVRKLIYPSIPKNGSDVN
jgi:small-conductance mechanosensitive channel